MGKLKFCANISWLFQEDDFLKRYQLAANAGFCAVEAGWPYQYSVEDVVRAKEEAGVEQILINTGSGSNLGNAGNFKNSQLFKDELDLAIKYAIALKCKCIHIMAGNIDKDEDRKKAMEAFVENLKYAGDKLQLHGMTGLIEPINSMFAPKYLLSTSTQALDILKLVNKPNILYQLDFFHLQVMEGNLSQTLKKHLSSIGHIQVSQVPNRNEPSASGEIQYSYIFSLLEELGYNGWIGCEYKPTSSTAESLQWLKEYV